MGPRGGTANTARQTHARHDGNVRGDGRVSAGFVVTQDHRGVRGHRDEEERGVGDFDEDLIEIDGGADALLRGVEFAKTIWILFDRGGGGDERVEGQGVRAALAAVDSAVVGVCNDDETFAGGRELASVHGFTCVLPRTLDVSIEHRRVKFVVTDRNMCPRFSTRLAFGLLFT